MQSFAGHPLSELLLTMRAVRRWLAHQPWRRVLADIGLLLLLALAYSYLKLP
jgi:hypothetical protein